MAARRDLLVEVRQLLRGANGASVPLAAPTSSETKSSSAVRPPLSLATTSTHKSKDADEPKEDDACRRLRASCQAVLDLLATNASVFDVGNANTIASASSAHDTTTRNKAGASHGRGSSGLGASASSGLSVFAEAYVRLEQVVFERDEMLSATRSRQKQKPRLADGVLEDVLEQVQFLADVVESKLWDCIGDCLTLASTPRGLDLLRDAVEVLTMASTAQRPLFQGGLGMPSSNTSDSDSTEGESASTSTNTSNSDAGRGTNRLFTLP